MKFDDSLLSNSTSEQSGALMQLSHDQAIVSCYGTYSEAEPVVHRLASCGLPAARISIVGQNFEGHDPVQVFYHLEDGVSERANAKRWAGGLFDVLVGTGLFVLPTVGLLFILGPLGDIVAFGLRSSGTEALICGLVSFGIPRSQAKKYQDSIREGEFLVVVYGATTSETEAALTLLQDTKPHLLQTHSIFHSGMAPSID